MGRWRKEKSDGRRGVMKGNKKQKGVRKKAGVLDGEKRVLKEM